MARPRPRPSEQGSRELRVDPGPAPQLEPDADVDLGHGEHVVDDERPELAAGPTPLEVLAEWELETVEMLLGVLLLGFHWTLGRGGPPDAYVPDDAERASMARPATRILNRSERARRLAKHGDLAAFTAAFGGFVVKETEEVARYRAGEGPGEPTPDDALADLGVREATEADVRGPVRRWRPPVLPDEPPPA